MFFLALNIWILNDSSEIYFGRALGLHLKSAHLSLTYLLDIQPH